MSKPKGPRLIPCNFKIPKGCHHEFVFDTPHFQAIIFTDPPKGIRFGERHKRPNCEFTGDAEQDEAKRQEAGRHINLMMDWMGYSIEYLRQICDSAAQK